MSMKQPKPPKPDKSLIEAQKAQKQAELQRIAELKQQQLEETKARLSGGVRSLITSGGGGYGRNFFG